MNVDKLFQRLVVTGCVCAALGVAAGAFGAHMLKGLLDPPMLAVYDTATRYQMYHAFGIVLSGFAVRVSHDARLAVAGWMFLAGIFLFCGSLYGVALLGVRWLGAIRLSAAWHLFWVGACWPGDCGEVLRTDHLTPKAVFSRHASPFTIFSEGAAGGLFQHPI